MKTAKELLALIDRLPKEQSLDIFRMIELTGIVRYHDKKYHQDDEPEIPNAEYDVLFHELKALELKYPNFVMPDSPTQKVGFETSDLFTKVKHITPMRSLDNVFNTEELRLFDDRVVKALKSNPVATGETMIGRHRRYTAEPKYDGLSIDLIYKAKNGVPNLFMALTRGDGETGEDVTANVIGIKGIPLVIPELEGIEEMEIRGEIVMPKAALEKASADRVASGKKPFANTRNAAAGSIRQLDPEVAASRGLEFMLYGYGVCLPLTKSYLGPSHYTNLRYLKSLGFNWPEELCFRVEDIHEIEGAYAHLLDKRPSLPYEIDGMVLKVDHLGAQGILGFIAKSPRFATAYKFPAEEATSTVEAIDIQVGRTGALTPVARIEPVLVGGVVVSNVTLNNYGKIVEKGIEIGSMVIVRRAGDVVPEIVKAYKEVDTITKSFHMPEFCPVCNSPTYKEEDGAIYRCTGGIRCSAQRKALFIHAVGRKMLNIMGMGDQIIAGLLDWGLIETLADIYRLTKDKLMKLETVKHKAAAKLLDAIDASRVTTASRVIYALGIRHVGEETAKLLAHEFEDVRDLFTVDEETLLCIDGIGPETAGAVVEYFRQNFRDVSDLLDQLKITKVLRGGTENQTLEGCTFVVTGSFPGKTREDVKAELEARGAKTSSSVSKNTTALVFGSGGSSEKSKKALDLGVDIIDFIPKVYAKF